MPGKTPLGADMTLVSLADCDRLPALRRMAARLAEQIDACDNAQFGPALCRAACDAGRGRRVGSRRGGVGG